MAMRSVWLANGINIVLDPLLIFGLGPFPELGLTGAAVATTIGRGTGVAYQFWGLSRGRRLRVRGSDVRLDLRIVRSLLRISGGGVGQLLVSQASYIGLIRILASFGTAVLAGYVVAIRVVIFIIMPAWGLSNAAATLVGQNLGARKPKRAERAVYVTGAWNMLFMTFITVLFVTFAPQIIAPFVADPESHAAGTSALRIISYGYVFYAWGMVMLQAFNGAGDTATPTKLNFVIFWLFQLPLAWILARTLGLGPVGVYWAIAIAYSLSAVIGILLFRRGRWKEKEV
jgi:putative MATE family efflux protein